MYESIKRISEDTFRVLDSTIAILCREMEGRSLENIIALAEILRDLAVARAILTKIIT